MAVNTENHNGHRVREYEPLTCSFSSRTSISHAFFQRLRHPIRGGSRRIVRAGGRGFFPRKLFSVFGRSVEHITSRHSDRRHKNYEIKLKLDKCQHGQKR